MTRNDSTALPTAPDAPPVAQVRRASLAVYAVFFLSGLLFASWASRLPAVRDLLGLGESQMGVLLLFAAIGSICALPLAGLVVGRLGARRTVLAFGLVAALGYAAVALAVTEHQFTATRVALVVAGIGIGVWDAAMNLQGAFVEQRLGRSIMPRFHAFFSFGTVAGAGLGALAARLDVPLLAHLVVAAVVCAGGVAAAVVFFLPDDDGARPADVAGAAPVPGDATADPALAPSAHRSQLRTWTESRTLLIGLVVLGAALTEGAANDWLNLATVDGFDVGADLGALTLALFLLFMTLARLAGTPLLDRYGRVGVLRTASVLALAGILLFTLAPWLGLAWVGVALWGLGAALGFPVGMSAASDDPRRAAQRVSVVSTIGYSAFFVGPPLIGFVAHLVGYRHALLVVAVPVLLGLLAMNAMRPLPADEPADRRPTADRPLA